jgi:hypothetical protein
MCHDRVVGYSDGLNMWWGVRSAWWGLAKKPRNFCERVAMADPLLHRTRRIRDAMAEELQRIVAEHGLRRRSAVATIARPSGSSLSVERR